MSEKNLTTAQSSSIVGDLKLFTVLLFILLGSLVGLYYYDLRHPFITSVAERFFSFLLR